MAFAIKVEEYVYKGREFVLRVAEALQRPEDLVSAGSATVGTFRQLRNILSADESLHLIAQLPVYIKAIYVDDWITGEVAKGNPSEDHFQAVVSVLKKYVNAGEVNDLLE